MKLSIVIVTWNAAPYLRKLLASIDAHLGGQDREIIVVDNGSCDETAAVLKEWPDVRAIWNLANRGVARARNQGLRAARGDYLLLLDVDTEVLPGAIEHLVDWMDSHSSVGLVAPRLIDENGSLSYSCRQFPTLWTKLARLFSFLGPARQLLAREFLTDWEHTSPRTVDYVIGACQLIRRAAFEEVGELDEHIFYGPEDVDYCLRLWQAGREVMYVPASAVIHAEQRVTRRKLFSGLTALHLWAVVYYLFKHRCFFSRKAIYHKIEKTRRLRAWEGKEWAA